MSDEGTTCPRCGMTSYNPMDAIEGYCGNCNEWTRRPMHFDRQGHPITMERWGLLHSDEEYMRVGLDTFPSLEDLGEESLTVPVATVSTVWLGINHSFHGDPPIIFETMIFGGDYDQECMRYHTEDEAVQGHSQVMDDLREGRAPFWLAENMADSADEEN